MAYDLPSWLQADAPSEPFKALLAGAQVGTQIAQVRNQARAQDAALAQRRYEFDAVQEAQQKVQEYQLQEAQLHIEKMKLAKDYEFQTSRASIEIGNLVNTTDPSAPDFQNKLYGIAARYPAVMQSDVFKHASELPGEAAKAYHLRNPAPANAADAAAVSDQVKGLEYQSMLEGKPPFTELQKVTLANKLRNDKEFSKNIQGSLSWDDQGRPVLSIGGAGPTVGTASLAQKNLNIAEKNYELLDELDRNLRPADLGVRGKLGDIVDAWAPQVGLSGFDKTRATNREALKAAIPSVVRTISADPRFTENDHKRAAAAMVSEGWSENKERATAVLGELKDIIRSRSRIDAETGGLPRPGFTMSEDEIDSAVRSGIMPKAKAMELRKRYYPQNYLPPIGASP